MAKCLKPFGLWTIMSYLAKKKGLLCLTCYGMLCITRFITITMNLDGMWVSCISGYSATPPTYTSMICGLSCPVLYNPFRSGRNGRKISYRYANRYESPPCSTSANIPGRFARFGPFRPVPAGMSNPVGILFGFNFWFSFLIFGFNLA